VEYRGVEYAVVRTIPNGWRWSIKRDDGERFGTSDNRDTAIARAKKSIDHLIKEKVRKARQHGGNP
jgi:hypothetical protein